MTISQFHQQVADVADRIPNKAAGAMRPTKPARTGQNRGLMRQYKAMKQKQAEERNGRTALYRTRAYRRTLRPEERLLLNVFGE